MNIKWHEFPTSGELAGKLAADVADLLTNAIAERGGSLLAISGGTTPQLFLEELSKAELDWQKVTVTLADERFVPPSSERSNARLAARHLLKNHATKAPFIPLYRAVPDVERAADEAATAISAVPLPFDVMVLGMGTDGHTASLFPDADNITELLDAKGGPTVLPVIAPSAGEPRLTLSMQTICSARAIILHIEGDDKRAVLEQALASEPVLPIRAVIERAAVPVHIYWAPKG